MNPQIFREYDIRGIVGRDFEAADVERIGLAFGTYVRQHGGKRLVVGRDHRLSSPSFCTALTKGLQTTGCDVVDIGLVPTPLLYFALFHLNTDGGCMITASHNPAEYNGIKLCLGRAALYGDEIQAVRRLAEAGPFAQGPSQRTETEVRSAYITSIAEQIQLRRRLRVVVDAGNGTSGLVIQDLLRRLGCDIHELYCEVDGTFPHHHPDPTVPENLTDLIREVQARRADVGLAYDGDSDRLGVIDEQGQIIWGDRLLVLFARDILSRRPGAKVIFDVKCSQVLEDDILRRGGTPIMWKTGHSLIKKKLYEERAAVAGEMSGHLFFADGYFGYDDALYASCRLLQILDRADAPLSALLSDLPVTYSTPEIRVTCADEAKFSVVDQLQAHLQGEREVQRVITIDGARAVFADGWGLVRASNTQPALVLRFEATTPARLQAIQSWMLDRLRAFPAVKLDDAPRH
ncbi:MAG TPA: phosphomannomutase/phosphoglucomutase [Alphaproteobacteria bacterium]|nr:phosphomannomutase/phosphoglucomutase [Alphaproteobacteria bacterium]